MGVGGETARGIRVAAEDGVGGRGAHRLDQVVTQGADVAGEVLAVGGGM